VAHIASFGAGIHVLLRLDWGLNKVDVAKKEARIKAQDFVFQVQMDQGKKLKDQLEQGEPVNDPYVPGLDELVEKCQDFFAL